MISRVRPLAVLDLPAVLAIEAEVNPSPWRAQDFTAFLPPARFGLQAGEASSEIESAGQPMAVVYADPEVRGFLCAMGAADEVEVQSLAVEKVRWRSGVGSALMETLFAWVKSGRYRAIHLEVRENNARGVEFYKHWGFAAVGRRPNYYNDNGEAAILMSLVLSP